MSAKNHEAIVRQLLDEAYNKRNLAVGDELLADDCVLHALPKAIQGIAGWKMFSGGISHSLP